MVVTFGEKLEGVLEVPFPVGGHAVDVARYGVGPRWAVHASANDPAKVAVYDLSIDLDRNEGVEVRD